MFSRVLALSCALLAVFAATAAAQAPSLTGETLTATYLVDSFIVQSAQCTPDGSGSGSFTYQTIGPATGPYPGTYVENGTFTFAPGVLQPVLTSFQATFRIDATSGTVITGTKSSSGGTPSFGCINDGPVNAVGGTATATYQATITAAGGGKCTDSGTSAVNLQATAIPGGETTQIVEGTFTETFASSNVTAMCLPTTFDDCKGDAWQLSGLFKNQGDCIAFVATMGRNEASAR